MIKVINVLTDTNIGGAGTYLLTFLDHYDKNAIDMEVFIPINSKLKVELEKRNVPFTEVPYIDDASFDRRAIFGLVKLLREKKPNIVHAHAALSARIVARAAQIHGCKIVHTRHSVFEPPEKHTKFPYKNILGLINNMFSDCIIAVSPAAKKNLTDTGTSHKKIKVIMNGVKPVKQYTSEEKLDLRKKYDLTKDDFVVTIIARLEDIKGHDYILDAAKLINDSSIKILAAGTGSYEQHLKNRIKDENIQNVRLIGFISDIDEIENIMDLQINASYGTEATSYSLLEGMSLGVPAIVSDFGGNPYVITEGKTGLIVKQKDPQAIAKAIVTLKGDCALYSKMSKNAVVDYNKRFTAKNMCDKICRLYVQLANRKGDHCDG